MDKDNLKPIDFFDISFQLLKPPNNLEYSYLNAYELNKVSNFPVKEGHVRDAEKINKVIQNNGICLLIAVDDSAEEDSLFNKLKEIENISFEEVIFLHKKRAFIEGGLGQYGKNQLVYSKKFGFDFSAKTFLIYNKVKNLPLKQPPNNQLLNKCKNCNLCITNCPAHAIHGNDSPGWLDETACRIFYYYGDHEFIPSIKYGINNFLNKKYSNEELKQVKTYNDFVALFGFDHREGYVENCNGKSYKLAIDFCRECMNQAPCRREKHIYDKEKCIILDERSQFDFF